MMRIGVYDSGLGGLTVLRELLQTLSGAEYFYLGDTARTPYGPKGPETITRYALECSRFLLTHDIELLVVACNTVSSVALPLLARELPCPVIGTIDPAVSEALSIGGVKRIGVIGTQATITSGQYESELSARSPDLQIWSKACPLFVPVVEEGLLRGRIVESMIQHYLSDLAAAEIDALILGCTHYPLLAEALQAFFGDGVRLIECSKAIAAEVAQIHKLPIPSKTGVPRFFVTDDVKRFNALAGTFLGVPGIEAQRVEVG